MLLQVNTQPRTLTATTFTFVVPGHQIWNLQSVVAVATTGVGGQPNRGYTLTVARGATLVVAAGAEDAGTEPATVTITWANTAQAVVTAGNIGVSVAPMIAQNLEAGYVITGTIIGPAGADTWVSATAWYVFRDNA